MMRKEIDAYLASKRLKYIESRMPNTEDWANSPFEKPKSVRLNISYSTPIGNKSIPEVSYHIIETANKSNTIVYVWIEETKYPFISPKYVFRIRKTKSKLRSVLAVTDICPACSFKIDEQVAMCPDCGLHFQ